MSEPNLLGVIPEQLLQTHYITEVDNVQKKIHYEIERKREELRGMVGEKYRDLIQAADTIEEMKHTTASTLAHFSDMILACKTLHETHLVGFKIDNKPSHSVSALSSNNPAQTIAVQIKLLMELPEKIWACIEEENFVKATQLFIMSRHVNTGLQLQLGSKNLVPGSQSLQRLVQQQWNSISNLNETIVNLCKNKLQDVDITVEVASSCLVTLYLLDSQSMTDLLNTLIDLTSNNSLKHTLKFDLSQIIDGDMKATIKEKIVNALKIVLKTVVLVYSCFVENNGGTVLEKLNDLFKKESGPLINLVSFSDTQGIKLMPQAIVNYRLSSNKELQQLNKEEITKCVVKWNEWVKSFISDSLKTLLQNVTRVKVLHEIREEAFKIETPQNWESICSELDIPEVHIWCHYFQPLITNRVKEIIDSRWTKLYDDFKTQMLVDLTKVSSESEVEKEANINWFVWKDLIGDTIIESRNDVVKVMNSLMKGMWHQDRGFTPTLQRLCKELDMELQKMLEDLKLYLNKSKGVIGADKLLYSFDKDSNSEQIFSDRDLIRKYLMDVSDKNIQSILQYIKACFEESTLQSTLLQKKTTAIYTARFSQAIPILMPHLHKIYISEDRQSLLDIVDADSIKRWEEVCGVLKESSLYCWGKWVIIVMEKVVESIQILPQEFTLEANIDYLMMQWDTIKIEEKDDEGNALETSIKVPSCPSLKLQEYLYAISRILDEVIPHTLPSEIHTTFIENVATITLKHFEKVIRENKTDINQRCALQLLMDVRHTTLLLVPRENKVGIDLSHEICEFLRQMIDPFDYDVFYPYIQTNLKRSVQRVQTLLGSLVVNHGELSVVVGTKMAGGATTPALLAGVSGDVRHWFSLLPVAAPLSKKNVIEPQKKKQSSASPSKGSSSRDISDLMTGSLPINFATARSGAASFFNSMTSDWFSGS